MITSAMKLLTKAAAALALASALNGCGGDEIMTVKYPLVWAGMVAGGPTGEWLWGDCSEFAPPRRQAQLCELRRDVTESAAEREARLARNRIEKPVCARSLADRTCHADIVYVLPGRQ